MFSFAKYKTYETGFRMLKLVSLNTKFRETRSIFLFSRNTKLVSDEICGILYERNSSVNPRHIVANREENVEFKHIF